MLMVVAYYSLQLWSDFSPLLANMRAAWNTAFYVKYIITTKTNKGKSLCVSLILLALLENH